MNDIQIKCFLAAAGSQSFSEAAEKVYMTAPTFGRYISGLERELGYPLFLRGWKKLRLTAAGELMYEGFQEIITRFDQLQDDVRRLNSGETGHLTVGLLKGQIPDDRLRKILSRFGEECPKLTVKLERYSFLDMGEALLSGKVDVGITLTIAAKETEDLDFHPFSTLPNAIVMAREHPLANADRLDLPQLRAESFLEVAAEESPAVAEQIHACCRAAGFVPKQVRCTDLDAQLFAVEAGQGVMVANQNHVACHNPALVTRFLPELPPVEFCVAWHRANPNPAVQIFTQGL